jgi:hypothetical protein
MASKCLSSGSSLGILNVNFRATLRGSGDNAVGAFVGMEGTPIAETIEFAWVPCNAAEPEIEVPANDKC